MNYVLTHVVVGIRRPDFGCDVLRIRERGAESGGGRQRAAFLRRRGAERQRPDPDQPQRSREPRAPGV